MWPAKKKVIAGCTTMNKSKKSPWNKIKRTPQTNSNLSNQLLWFLQNMRKFIWLSRNLWSQDQYFNKYWTLILINVCLAVNCNIRIVWYHLLYIFFESVFLNFHHIVGSITESKIYMKTYYGVVASHVLLENEFVAIW